MGFLKPKTNGLPQILDTQIKVSRSEATARLSLLWQASSLYISHQASSFKCVDFSHDMPSPHPTVYWPSISSVLLAVGTGFLQHPHACWEPLQSSVFCPRSHAGLSLGNVSTSFTWKTEPFRRGPLNVASRPEVSVHPMPVLIALALGGALVISLWSMELTTKAQL